MPSPHEPHAFALNLDELQDIVQALRNGDGRDRGSAIQAGQVARVITATQDLGGHAHDVDMGVPDALDALLACLRSPPALAESFRRGHAGPPDFSALAFALSAASPRPVMASISAALRGSRPVRRKAVHCEVDGESRGEPARGPRSAVPCSPSRVVPADVAALMESEVADTSESDLEAAPGAPHVSWIALALAAALPLLEGSLPKDERGVAMLPHQHPMQECHADEEGHQVGFWGGRRVWITRKVCDRCMDPIYDRCYYHCSRGCDIDFCTRCQEELEAVLGGFLARGGAAGTPAEYLTEKMLWVVHTLDEFAVQILSRSADDRIAFAQLVATEWPSELFQRLVAAVVDVCNAKMLYNDEKGALATYVTCSADEEGRMQYSQESSPIHADTSLWYTIGFLEILYACNGLLDEQVLDSFEKRGPKIAYKDFILEGINKCKPEVEWEYWLRYSSTRKVDVLRTPTFRAPRSFRSLVAHSDLLPISFRRRCMLADIRGSPLQAPHMVLHVDREPSVLIEDLVAAFPQRSEALAEGATCFRKLLEVSFKGEATQGPGVRREFFQVALRAFLASLFTPTERRTYWFSGVHRPEAYFACGVLLGQALLNDVLIPNVFAWPLYDMLLGDLGSPCAAVLSLAHLAAVSQSEADSVRQVQEHEGPDINDVFGDLGWERVAALDGRTLTQETKADFVAAYVAWSLRGRYADQFGPLSEGFRAVVGGSVMAEQMVDAAHLERIVCGGEVPVDVCAIRRRASHQGWAEGDDDYIDDFWLALESLPEAMRLRFVVFVTASDRVPLRGWDELRVVIQKNGTGDERLPSAYTCFSLVLLPKYSSAEVLRSNLLSAITNSEGFGLQ